MWWVRKSASPHQFIHEWLGFGWNENTGLVGGAEGKLTQLNSDSEAPKDEGVFKFDGLFFEFGFGNSSLSLSRLLVIITVRSGFYTS